jgi:hypothetical protein
MTYEAQTVPIPRQNHRMDTMTHGGYAWERSLYSPQYQYADRYAPDARFIDATQKFANTLVSNSIEIDSSIVALVDEHFWDLI